MSGNSFKAALAVCNCAAGDIGSNTDTLEKLTVEAASNGVELICFPEMNLTGYYNNPEVLRYSLSPDSASLARISSIASDLSMTILAGFAETGHGGMVFATHGVFFADGRTCFYRKLHIAPPEMKTLLPGNGVPLFEFKGIRFGIQLCYDAHFPELSTKMSLSGLDVLFIPHASPRGTPEEKLRSWMRHLPARAFDNGIIVAACNQSGDNGKGLVFPGVAVVLDPSGEVNSTCLTEEDELLYFQISKTQIDEFRAGRMRYFLPNRRSDLFNI